MTLEAAKLIPWLPALAAVLCGLCAANRRLRVLAAPICILSIATAFVITFLIRPHVPAWNPTAPPPPLHLFEWMDAGSLRVGFDYLVDPLTFVMLLVVTGVGTLVAWYAAGYMAGDRGYARFFAFVSLFIFAMTTLVMADNLVVLYLGWEGVGLCSYLLIGFYYQKPSAVAAAKKAFIVNRIGDVGFAIGIFLTYVQFGDLSLSRVLAAVQQPDYHANLSVQLIPFLLMLGAFGKSAQIPLYVWLPDAMEGPTPVSALIHAATMVTAGVYMVARLLPLFALSPAALPTVAVIGAATALFAATIALCQYDIKRIYAYSTVSQLGYMFLGVGAVAATAGIFHLFTHAFFKALLFLTAGSVMHALAGQLDLRKMSGLFSKMPVTALLMLAGCLALAGFPFTSGFYSKDAILAAVFERGLGEHGQLLFLILGIIGLFTAFLTAYYTFRLWFRVFLGPEKYEMGHEHHAVEAAADSSGHDHGHGSITTEHRHEPHEVSFATMNAPLVILAVGALVAGWAAEHWHWMAHQIGHSTAVAAAPHAPTAAAAAHHATLLGMDLHRAMMGLSAAIAIAGIAVAAYFHWLARPAADRVAARYPGLVRLLANKYYVDELYDRAIVTPLYRLSEFFYIIDRLIIDGLLYAIAFLPRALGLAVQPAQSGALQGYGLGMLAGAAAIAFVVFLFLR